MNDIFIIIIAPFDLFGQKKYMYTFKMTCQEDPTILLNDGATRIFLNTRGENDDEVSPELVELLHYIENTTQEMADTCKSTKIREMQKRICNIKSSEEVGVKYMQLWEEKIIEQDAAREEGREEGQTEILQLLQLLSRNGRAADIERLTTDIAFRQKLLKEYQKKK